MEPFIKKIRDYIETLNEEEVIELWKKNYDIVLPRNSDIPKNKLFDLITLDYPNHRNDCERIHNEIKSEEVKIFLENNPAEKYRYAMELNLQCKFCKTDTIVAFFRKLGIRDMYLDFVELDNLENIMFDIIRNGIIVKLNNLIILVDKAYNNRLYNNFNDFLGVNRIDEYDKRKNVTQVEIDIINFFRKRKYNAQFPKKQSAFNKEMNKMFDSIDDTSIQQKLSADVLLNPKRGLQLLLQEFLDDSIKNLGINKIFKVFKPFFHIIFEDNMEGLLSESNYDTEYSANDAFAEKYNGNYWKYYQSRIRTLTGLKDTFTY